MSLFRRDPKVITGKDITFSVLEAPLKAQGFGVHTTDDPCDIEVRSICGQYALIVNVAGDELFLYTGLPLKKDRDELANLRFANQITNENKMVRAIIDTERDWIWLNYLIMTDVGVTLEQVVSDITAFFDQALVALSRANEKCDILADPPPEPAE